MNTPSRKKYTRGNASGSGHPERRGYVRKDGYGGKSKESFRKPDPSGNISGSADGPRGFYKRTADGENQNTNARNGRPDRPSFSRNKGDFSPKRRFTSTHSQYPSRNASGSEDGLRGSFKRTAGGETSNTNSRNDRPGKSSFSKNKAEFGAKRRFASTHTDERRKTSENASPSWKNERGDDAKPGTRSYPKTDRTFGEKKVTRPAYADKHATSGFSDRGRAASGNQGKGARPQAGTIRLNKYIAEHGLCSRREADTYIASGVISVNGKVVTELGTKVFPTDEVRFNGERMREDRKVYILLNKPKDYVTTTDDPHAKRTVLELIDGACKERVYPVGRLDRNTTGVLLITNDGDLTKRISHPSYNKKKVYHAFLDKRLRESDLRKLTEGFELEDGFIQADAASFVDLDDKTQVGIEIHSGRNRIVRRIFEHLGYQIKKLDRVYYAGLTKKSLPRGHWRFLTEKEIKMLKTGAFD